MTKVSSGIRAAFPVPLHDDRPGGPRVGQTRVNPENVWHLH
jgi:hypothetical protein